MKILHTRSTKLARAAAITSILALGACVTAPHNDQWVDPADVDFAGYAEYAGADIEVQALDKQTGEWVTIDTSSAGTFPIPYGGEELYRWFATGTDTTSSGHCVWGDPAQASCPISPGAAEAQFRVQEVDNYLLTTFEAGGVDCVTDMVIDGLSWTAAGYTCKSPETPVLTLHASF